MMLCTSCVANHAVGTIQVDGLRFAQPADDSARRLQGPDLCPSCAHIVTIGSKGTASST